MLQQGGGGPCSTAHGAHIAVFTKHCFNDYLIREGSGCPYVGLRDYYGRA